MVLGERSVKWIWRRFLGADDFTAIEVVFPILFAAGIVVALLCKIRALTKPDYGNGPWAWSALATLAALAAMLVFR
jgi:asparagine N-glycosylation enzyme membrane subunit Stt3